MRQNKDFFSNSPPVTIFETEQIKEGIKLALRPKDLGIFQRLEKLGFKKSNRILDFGTANGVWLERLLANNKKIGFGVDIAEKLIKEAKTRNKKRGEYYLTKDNWNLPKGFFDFAVSFDVFEHIVDKKKEIGRIYSSLKPKGKFLFYALNRNNAFTFDWLFEKLGSDFLYKKADHHKNVFPDPKRFSALLRREGFTKVEFELYDGPFNLFWDVFCYGYLSIIEMLIKRLNIKTKILTTLIVRFNNLLVRIVYPLNNFLDSFFHATANSNGFFVWGEKE